MPPDKRIWHHVTIGTYGSWLHGDSRGFRTRNHREHVDGDYKDPPPAGMYADKERRSRELLAQPAFVLPPEWRPRVGRAIWQELTRRGAWLLAIAVAGQHVHMLVKLPLGRQRKLTGLAKRQSTLDMRNRGWQGKLWAVRSKGIRIRNRAHQVNTFNYILRHAEEGAWVGVWKTEGVDEAPGGG